MVHISELAPNETYSGRIDDSSEEGASNIPLHPGNEQPDLETDRAQDVQRADRGRPFYPRRGRGGHNRGNSQWRVQRNRNRGPQRWQNNGYNQTRDNSTTANEPGHLAPLSAAKGVIKSKLSVMFRGLRGIEAAQAAFDMCGVDIGFQVNERRNQPSPGSSGRGRQADRVPISSDKSQAGLIHSPVGTNVDSQQQR